MEKPEFTDVFTSNYYTEEGKKEIQEMIDFMFGLRGVLSHEEYLMLFKYMEGMFPEMFKFMAYLLEAEYRPEKE